MNFIKAESFHLNILSLIAESVNVSLTYPLSFFGLAARTTDILHLWFQIKQFLSEVAATRCKPDNAAGTDPVFSEECY
jgi:hypothetical protein